VNQLPYTKLPNGRALVEESALIASFTNSEPQAEYMDAERWVFMKDGPICWILLNWGHLHAVQTDEQGSGNQIVRIIDRPLTPNEQTAYEKCLELYRVP
jgi:hypothetical protein